MESPTNLMDGLLNELTRNKELLTLYESIPQGKFGAIMIRRSIDAAEKAIADNDIVAMIQAYKLLKEHQ